MVDILEGTVGDDRSFTTPQPNQHSPSDLVAEDIKCGRGKKQRDYLEAEDRSVTRDAIDTSGGSYRCQDG